MCQASLHNVQKYKLSGHSFTYRSLALNRSPVADRARHLGCQRDLNMSALAGSCQWTDLKALDTRHPPTHCLFIANEPDSAINSGNH